MTLKPIVGPETNHNAPDQAVAQSIAENGAWQIDDASGEIYDAAGAYVAASLDELTQAMDDLGWFIRARSSGPNWHEIPADDPERADRVRQAVRRRRGLR